LKILVIDIGGTNVKMLASGQDVPRKFPSGKKLTPLQMVNGVLDATKDWEYQAITIGYPGPVLCGQPMLEPANLGSGWMGFDFEAAFHHPVKIINDAAMQALGSYQGGKMLFLGLGTGFGTTVVMDGVIEPLELAHYQYKKKTFEDYVGVRALKRIGRKKWQRNVEEVVEHLVAIFKPDDLVLGGGNAKKLKGLPPGARLGNNSNAFAGGLRLWEGEGKRPRAFAWTPNSILPKSEARQEV
jgi:polyphosphate glucokinase